MSTDYTEDREPLDTKNMLETAFFDNLSKLGSKIAPASEPAKVSKQVSVASNYNTESVLIELFEVRDSLIESVNKMGIVAASQPIVKGINKLGSCIRSLGGEVPHFDPVAHISGLQNPSLKRNAVRVIENTKEAYSIGKIANAQVSDDGKTLTMEFTGQQDNIDYKAVGTIVASKTWVGNEAIDYIYTPSEGRMSVKIFNEDGKWVDKSDSYKISWELFEKEADLNVMPVDVEIKPSEKEGKTTKIAEIKEEVQNDTSNNDTDEEIGDFPIEEKNEN